LKEWDEKFKRDNIDLIEKLESGDEMERLWALAKLEEKCYGSGVPNFLIDQIIRCMEQDESSIVRAFAIRVLYHQSSEIWPLDEAKRAKILEAIKNILEGVKVLLTPILPMRLWKLNHALNGFLITYGGK